MSAFSCDVTAIEMYCLYLLEKFHNGNMLILTCMKYK